MAVCSNCGKKIGFVVSVKKVEGQTVCKDCEAEINERNQKQKEKREEILAKGVTDILATTLPSVEGYKIKQHLGIVSSQVVMGVNAWKDFLANMSDAWGGRSRTLQTEFKKADGIAIQELKVEAVMLGGNAVIGATLDYEIIDTAAGGKMIMTVATGSSVTIEKQ